MINIGLDMMGGDFAPLEAIKGIKLYRESNLDAKLTLFGDTVAIATLLASHGLDPQKHAIIHTTQVIDMHEHPTKAMREKLDSSISVGFQHLANGQVDAFISAGNTGAMMVGSLFSIKTIDGVHRPTIGAYMPRENGKLGWLLDVGINSDCKPENLVQFAILGSLFVEQVLNIPNPRVGLINIGEEEGKGNILSQAAYSLLKEESSINFIGNVEGRDIFLDKADVMVCEGFTGNVILKLGESIYPFIQKRGIKDAFFDMFEFEQYGGVPVLGVNKPVIIGHGISNAKAFKNMITIAQTMIEKDLMGKIKERFNA